MNIEDVINIRGIKEILHFTTSKGFTGIMASGKVKARDLLPNDDYLEHVIMYNCANRQRDKAYWGFVNLSITTVNRSLFGISKGNWHYDEDCWWCILAFLPHIATHEGVIFTTTNNMYSSVSRTKGVVGLEAMFKPEIIQWYNRKVTRKLTTPFNQPTCEQAEILYPKELSLDHLKCIYVNSEENAAKADAILSVLPNSYEVPICIRKDLF